MVPRMIESVCKTFMPIQTLVLHRVVCTIGAQYDQNNLRKSSKDRPEATTRMIHHKVEVQNHNNLKFYKIRNEVQILKKKNIHSTQAILWSTKYYNAVGG